jgi:hypothetical protein
MSQDMQPTCDWLVRPVKLGGDLLAAADYLTPEPSRLQQEGLPDIPLV